MAQIAIAGSGGVGRRELNSDLPLIPFIDFLLCLIAFLLVTAVWSQMARLSSDAQVPGAPDTPTPPPARTLHVELRSPQRFQLVWREGSTVVSTRDVPRKAVPIGTAGDWHYPELASALSLEWHQHGRHRVTTDGQRDRLVLHVGNTTPFEELAAVLDAAHAPQRQVRYPDGLVSTLGAFSVAFAVD